MSKNHTPISRKFSRKKAFSKSLFSIPLFDGLGTQRRRRGSTSAASLVLEAAGEKGVRHLLCAAPSGPFRQKVPDPFFAGGGNAIERRREKSAVRLYRDFRA